MNNKLNNKGFTLVEILSVIVLISLIFGLGVAGVSKLRDNSNKRSLNTKINLIESAAQIWGNNNKTLLKNTTCEIDGETYDCYKVSVETLIEEDILDSEKIGQIAYSNPVDKTSLLNNCVYVYKKNNRVYSYYQKDLNISNCSDDTLRLNKRILVDNIAFPDNEASDYVSNPTGIDFSKISSDTNGKGLYYTSTNTQGSNVTYYFRGDVDNNYVRFGRGYKENACMYNGTIITTTYDDSPAPTDEYSCSSVCLYDGGYSTFTSQEFCAEYGGVPLDTTFGNAMYDLIWRIVRINEDGSVRLILDNTIGEDILNENYASPFLDYSTSAGLLLNDWYNSNLSQYDSMLTNTGYCNYSTETNNGMGNTYDIYGRINTTSPTPQFKCSNRITTSKVGLITADEVVYAGGKFGVNNTNYYLYNANIFWTMSPYKSEVGNSYAINVSKNGAIQSACSGNNNGVIDDSGKSGIRPVLNLHKNVNITDLSQNGTIENPYIIEY